MYGFLAFIFVLIIIAAVMAAGAGLLMLGWNLFLPVVWSAAPVLHFWPAVGLMLLIGAIRGLVTINNNRVAK